MLERSMVWLFFDLLDPLRALIDERVAGEILPPTKDNLLKFASETSFNNSCHHAKSDQIISVPPPRLASGKWQVPLSLKQECTRIKEDILGAIGEALGSDTYRICW